MNVLVSMRLHDFPAEQVTPGSIIDFCSVCGSAVWLAPSSQRLLEKLKDSPEPTKVICQRCLVPMVGVVKPESVEMPEGAAEELVQAALHRLRN